MTEHTYEPVEGVENQWVRDDGMLMVAREGQSLESLLDEMAEPPPIAVVEPEPAPPPRYADLLDALAAEGMLTREQRARLSTRLQG